MTAMSFGSKLLFLCLYYLNQFPGGFFTQGVLLYCSDGHRRTWLQNTGTMSETLFGRIPQ